ncbi:alpha/beta fold hydrolase [Neoroseomonas oryzicola]|uniref:Alpha/beta hydrolase n=1 Tax=Neoroseomonas oryzicola TaxID=535904 RepID=A0A9X9WP26_9PROT|nr:alpha/beta hydrolase [Neoroseomonas oryzicola]MBR0662086.1 alpha/beta hydrolase [Neoroseomonas oryzicola]NKE18863.1 alpha/beta hydrolase [Neoroseomonas oryzicola]
MTFTAPPRRAGWIERPDARIRYEVTGEGPAIVFAHGLGGNLMSWWQQVAHFATRYTCVAFSHRGFFPSTAPAEGPDPAAYAADLAALVDELGIADDLRIVCQSMGGWTGVEYALMRPGRVKALVLGSTTGSLDARQMREPERSRLEPWKQESAAARVALLKRNILPSYGARMAEEQPALSQLYNHVYGLTQGFDREAVRARLDALRSRPPESLAAAKCPVLFVPPEEDIVLPPFAAAAMAPVIPGAKVVPIPKAGHSAQFERAAEFNAIVDAFFAEVGA